MPAEFINENLLIETNVIEPRSVTVRVKLVFLGSTCIYPGCPQPITRRVPADGPLEPTNEAYAIAKIAGLKMCEAYARQYGNNSSR